MNPDFRQTLLQEIRATSLSKEKEMQTKMCDNSELMLLEGFEKIRKSRCILKDSIGACLNEKGRKKRGRQVYHKRTDRGIERSIQTPGINQAEIETDNHREEKLKLDRLLNQNFVSSFFLKKNKRCKKRSSVQSKIKLKKSIFHLNKRENIIKMLQS